MRQGAHPRSVTVLSWAALVLAALEALGGVGMAVIGNQEGVAGGFFYVALFALPLLFLGLSLRSESRGSLSAAGVTAAVLAAVYLLILVGNWEGYDSRGRVLAPLALVPVIALDLAVVAVTAVAGARHRRPRHPGGDGPDRLTGLGAR